MTIEQQVVSLELAKKLKELGVKQESLLYYQNYAENSIVYKLKHASFCINSFGENVIFENLISAFTVAELGEMLPQYLSPETAAENEVYLTMYLSAKRDWWMIQYTTINHLARYSQHANTEADARAKMLIYLLENKLITL